jgi:hypothetical protein
MIKCPVCGRQLRKGELRHGTFACPGCKEMLDLPGPSRLEMTILVLGTIIASTLVAYLLGARAYALAFGFLLAPVFGVPIFAVLGFLRGALFPRQVRRHVPGWPDEGTILHITAPPDRPEKQAGSE